jgi:hypothetical protein
VGSLKLCRADMPMGGSPSSGMSKPMRGGPVEARDQTCGVNTSEGERQERIGRGSPGNTGLRYRIRRVLTSLEPRVARRSRCLSGRRRLAVAETA